MLSTLRVSERDVWQRVRVRSWRGAGEAACYRLTMRQQLGGRRDGWWLATSLACDSEEGAEDEEDAPPDADTPQS